MNRNITVCLERADELLVQLEAEYSDCLQSKAVSARAEQLTHEVTERLRSALDRTVRAYWDQKIKPNISPEDAQRATIYFPIAVDDHALDSVLGRWRWKSVRADHQPIYDFVRSRQPYVDSAFHWLTVLDSLAVAGKHIDLVPQTISVQKHITVTRGNSSVSWGPGVTFGSGVYVAGAPINPTTQRIVPTLGVTEAVIEWVAFTIGGHNVNAIGFCREAVQKTRELVASLWATFNLS